MGQQAWLPLLSLVTAVSSLKPIDVYWNISNPIFSAGFGSGYENVIEVNRDTHPWEYDQVSADIEGDAVCSRAVNGTSRKPPCLLLTVFKYPFGTVS